MLIAARIPKMAIPPRFELGLATPKDAVLTDYTTGPKGFWLRWESNPQISVLNADAYAKFGY